MAGDELVAEVEFKEEGVAEALGMNTTLESLVQLPGTKVINYEPSMMLALDEPCRLAVRPESHSNGLRDARGIPAGERRPLPQRRRRQTAQLATRPVNRNELSEVLRYEGLGRKDEVLRNPARTVGKVPECRVLSS